MCREEEGGKLALDVQIREERGVENFLRQTKIKGGGIGIKFISFFFYHCNHSPYIFGRSPRI